MKLSRRRLIQAGAGLALGILLLLAFRPAPVLVDTARVKRGLLRVTVEDDARTRVRDRYTISAPIQGRLLRTPLEPGDPVKAGETVVAEFAPRNPDLLDARSRAEAKARVARAEAALGEATARREQAETDLRFAVEELERARELFKRNVLSKDVLSQRERDEKRARQELQAAESAIQVATFEAEVARASLREVSPAENPAEGGVAEDGRLRLRSPIDGTVLRVYEQSARPLTAGTPILEVGNTARLEVVADFLSQDAVRILPGMPVLVRGYSAGEDDDDSTALRGEVRRVEPGGFTKVSALGVEEQRVNVVIDPVGEAEAWARLGDGYRVDARVVLWEGTDLLIVPTGALFRQDDRWATFVDDDGRARLAHLELGRRNGLEAEVTSGLDEGDRVILYPNELISDGTRIDAH